MSRNIEREFPRVQEKLEILAGERGRPDDAAVRLRQLRGVIQNLPQVPNSVQVSAAPTMQEHNALQADVQKLFDVFNALRALLR